MTRDEVRNAKATQGCRRCGRFGHWMSDHSPDGSLPSNAPSSATPLDQARIHLPERKPWNIANVRPPLPTAGSVRFNMASISSISSSQSLDRDETSGIVVGPLLDNDAPYSAIRLRELYRLSPQTLASWLGELEPVPDEFTACPKWQYGTGEHSSAVRNMLGSVILSVRAPCGLTVDIRHFVLDGSSQWVVGDNVTSHGITNLLGVSEVILPARDKLVHLPIHRVKRRLYLDFNLFVQTASTSAFSSSNSPPVP